MAALYVHVPFRESPSSAEAAAFVATVVREMAQYARPPFAAASFQTLYVGGGRPSLLPESSMRTLLEACYQYFDTTDVQEVTLELHPSDASPPVLTAFRRLGITRLSIASRPLTGATLRPLLQKIRHAGFERISLDLFFGGPGHSLGAWKARLHQAVDLRVPHVALHERVPTGDQDAPERTGYFAYAMTFLGAKGYVQYELTHFARPGHRSHYQTHVYAHGNVLGLGPGAESFWWTDRTDPSAARRWSNAADVATYRERLHHDASPVTQRERLAPLALAHEYVLLRLRTGTGLDLSVLANRYGLPLRDRHAETLERLAAEGLIHDDPDRVRLTARGRLLADAITKRLMRDS